MPTLYHGTLLENVPAILKNGIEEAEGWGGAGTVGVFLSGTPEGALYWAKLKYQRMNDEWVDAYDFDRYHGREADQLIVVLAVEVPEHAIDELKADEEQFEELMVDFPINDWKQSLKAIGDVRFDGPVPPAWVIEIIRPTSIE